MPQENQSDYSGRICASRRRLLEYARPDIVFQRLIGRAPQEATEFANWGMGWWRIRDMIDYELAAADTKQGKNAPICTVRLCGNLRNKGERIDRKAVYIFRPVGSAAFIGNA